MNILFISYDSPHIDRRILLFARALMENGYRVQILTPYAVTEKGFEDIEIINVFSGPSWGGAPASIHETLRTHGPQWFYNFAQRAYRAMAPNGITEAQAKAARTNRWRCAPQQPTPALPRKGTDSAFEHPLMDEARQLLGK